MSIMTSVSRRRFLVLGAAAAAVGCSPPPMAPRLSDVSFANRPPLVFRASRIDVREDYHAPLRAPYVEHEMPLPPARAARQWAYDRLQASGTGAFGVIFSIRDASVTEKSLAVRKGVQGAFNTDQAERYDATLDATIELIDTSTGVTTAQAAARVSRYATIAEDASVQSREAAWHTLIEGLMADFDARMEREIQTYMSRYLTR